MLVLKVVSGSMTPLFGGKPLVWKIGKKKRLNSYYGVRLCRRGYHYVSPGKLSKWYTPGNRVFIARVSGEIIRDIDKGVASEMTLLKEVTHLFRDVGWNLSEEEQTFINTVGDASIELAKREFGNE